MNDNWHWVNRLHEKCLLDIEKLKSIAPICEYDFYLAILNSAKRPLDLKGNLSIKKKQLMLSDFIKWYNKF